MDVNSILREWSPLAARLSKPTLDDACKVIEDACMEIKRLEKELVYQSKRQDLNEIKYKDMMLEVQNVIARYL